MSKDISRAAPALGYSPSESGCVALPSLRQKKFFLHTKADSIKKILKNQRGEANYFSAVIFIFITVLLLAFIIDLFGIISTKQQLDHCADQMVKQIQLSGGINAETDQLFHFLSGQISGAGNITVTGDARLGGFWNFNLVNIRIVSRGAGVSEHYWK